MPVDPSMAVGGAEWQIAPLEPAAPNETDASGFGGMLGQALESLAQTQTDAAAGAQSLAAGTAEDPTAVVMAVERAQLSMQMASQMRTKLVEAAQDIFHTQV
jgi:flagellar hook-basal body complex protein FliE